MDLKQLTKKKDEGNQDFKQKNYKQSISKFVQCIQTMQKQQSKQFLDKNSQIGKLYVVCLINASLACINLKIVVRYQQAIRYCDKALSVDSENIKGLYRRGLARKQMAEILERQNGVAFDGLLQIYQDASKDFEKLCLLDKNNELANKNLSMITKDIYRVTVGRGEKPNLGRETGQQIHKTQDKKGLQQELHVQKTKKKGKDMQKIMKQYKVQEVTNYVQQKVRSQYLTNPLPQLRSQLQKAIRTLQKSQDVYIQFVHRLNQQYLLKIQPTFDMLGNLVAIILKKGTKQSVKVLQAIQKQKAWKLLWKSYTAKQKQGIRQKFKQFGASQQNLTA